MVDNVSPEDQGTNNGLTDPGEGDYLDASLLASLAHNPNATDFVVGGLELQPDGTYDTVDVTQGEARVSDATAESAQTGEVRRNVTYDVEVDARSGLALTADATNHVYLDVLLDGNDSLAIVINTTGSAPSSPSLKLGTVDTAAQTVDEVNRNPDGTFATISADSELGNPVYATLSDVPSDLPEGAQVYVQDENAVYVEDGT